MDSPDGDVVKKVYTEPKVKPPRREESISNKTNRSDFSKNYMRDYRQEGKDYQRSPDKVKEFRRKQRKKFKEHLKVKKPMTAMLIDQELSWWKNDSKPVTAEEFNFMCERRGFDENEKFLLVEELSDLGLLNF